MQSFTNASLLQSKSEYFIFTKRKYKPKLFYALHKVQRLCFVFLQSKKNTHLT